MGLQSLLRRRPSAALVISCVALFVALGGVGWAAFSLPPHSVGTAQLKNGAVRNSKIHNLAVNFNKIQFNTVGIRRINHDQVQTRVSGTCSGPMGAIGAIDSGGRVSCNSTLPTEFGVGSGSIPIGTSATTVATKALPSGLNFLVLANPYATISSSTSGQRVTVSCTLGANGASQSRAVLVEVGAQTRTLQTAIPIVMPAPSQATAGAATLVCSHSSIPSSPRPVVSITATINALEVAGNG